jgi:hypothetical protein
VRERERKKKRERNTEIFKNGKSHQKSVLGLINFTCASIITQLNKNRSF